MDLTNEEKEIVLMYRKVPDSMKEHLKIALEAVQEISEERRQGISKGEAVILHFPV